MNKILSFLLALFFVPLFSAVADVSCPSGYTTVAEDVVYVSSDNTCPSGHTKLGGEYGADTILNCTTAQSENESICTYFAEQCSAGKYFNGTSYQTCLAGSYCDGSGIATPGLSGCSQTCPSNSSSQPGATSAADCICNDGYYMNNGVCETCPAGYACSGGKKTRCENGTYAGTGQSTCTTCPTPRNTIGAAIINPEANQDLNENGVFESKNECGVLYMFVEDFVARSNGDLSTDILDTYNPNSEANKRGNAYVYCSYNVSTDEYDLNCLGHPLYCAGGHYSSGWNSDEHTNKTETDKLPIYETATLDEFVQVYCEPVGEDYYSLSVSAFVDENGEPTDDYIYEEAINSLLSRTACPENSSTNGSTTATSCTCNDGYTLTGTIGGNVQTTIDACRPIPEFTITTTDMPADTLFEFMISAAGDYTINWGDGNIEFISIPTPAVTMISHTYTESGVRTIGIAGDATSYNTDEDFKYAVISFTDEYYVSKMRGTAFNYIAKIEGSLGAIFSGSAQNMFAHTFGKCENLTEIPGDLFKGVSGAANDMFRGTFAGCTSLETIPMGLFSGVTGAADSMFENVFSGCTGLQSLPEDLFASVVYEDASKDVTGLFAAAFIGCTGLTELPANLFSGIKVAGPQMFNATFANCSSLKTIYSGLFGNIAGSANSQYVLTFANCSSLSEIPEGLFASFSDDGENDNSAGVFYGTFGMCASLNKIPENLFENVTRATQYMFLSTFAGCEKLSNIPEKLFANIEGKPAEHSFANTFAGCTGLTGYVPATLFEKMDSTDYEAGPMTGIFEGTNYDTQCPVNNYQYKTGFEADWSGKVACSPCPDGYITYGPGATDISQCYIPCEKQCVRQTCPDNALNCTHGTEVTTGKQYYGETCNAKETACTISFTCPDGYTKSGLAQWAINNMDLLIGSETVLPMCGLDGLGSCDELKPGEWESYYEDGLPIKSATGVAVCNSVPGDDSTFGARINKDADFDLNTTGNYCWMKVQTVNGSFLPASWVYGWQYDTPEQCADDCGWSHNDNFQTVELAIVWGAEYDTCIANEYTVTYDCNGGTGNTTDTVTYNTTFTPRTDVCERDGHQFLGWTLNGASVSDSFVWNTTDNQTLVATWKQLSAECASGEYLPANTATCVPCKENNYCPGGKYDVSDTDTGINPCPENSSSQSGTTYCTCDNDFSIDGTDAGSKETTTGTCKLIPEFIIKTIDMPKNAKFQMWIRAAGTYFVDWGDGTPVQTISKTTIGTQEISHTYPTGGRYTIGMSGQATAFDRTTRLSGINFDHYAGDITFYRYSSEYNTYIYQIEGSLGKIFSTLPNGENPSFLQTFVKSSNLTGPIPETLFDGVYGQPVQAMFYNLFYSSSNLTGPIPEKLFSGIKGEPTPYLFASAFFQTKVTGQIPENLFSSIQGTPATEMFSYTFANSNLSGTIPKNLFSGISGEPAPNMFSATFWNTNLSGPIPEELFSKISGEPAEGMFAYTFYEAADLTGPIPEKLFSGIYGQPAKSMFLGTFWGSGISGEIPSNLFAKISGEPAIYMFADTFGNMKNLSGTIPANLFRNIKGEPAEEMFYSTFANSTGLSGYVPPELFAGIDSTNYASGPMTDIFLNSGIDTQCPENMYQYKTGFEVDWSDRVACTPCPNDGISPTGSTNITQCYIIKPCGQYTDITTTCYYNTESNDYTNCAECAVDSSCPYNQELVNGKCAPCNRDNAINYHETGNCMVSECEPGYQPYMQQCMPDKISCDAPNAEIAYQYWSIESRAYGPCIISKCVSGYNIEANACVPDVQPCELEHGTGTKTYNHDTGTWGKCIASECEPGYTTDSMLTDDVLDGQCGRCSNMFVDNDLAVSTYVSGCEIATCMYQGEKYILENNECRMICSELHDDTGDRYWNGKKCVQKCKDGYSMW